MASRDAYVKALDKNEPLNRKCWHVEIRQINESALDRAKKKILVDQIFALASVYYFVSHRATEYTFSKN